MRGILATLLTTALVLAGCADDEHTHSYACPDGMMVDTDVAGHHNGTFMPDSLCQPADPPAFTVTGIPATLGAYHETMVNWSMDLGDLPRAHSMFNAVLVSTEPRAVDNTTEAADYGDELAKAEHRDLPFQSSFTLSFDTPGTYYIRAYGAPEGEKVWSEEFAVEVSPVAATGETVTLVHAVGGPLGGFTAPVTSFTLGTTVAIQNDDVVEHTFTFAGTACSDLGEVTVAMQSASEAVLPMRPGSCTVTSDDVQPVTLALQVTAPGA